MATRTSADRNAAPGRRGFVRFDAHQRIQHILIMVSFILCIATGWPLKMADVEAAEGLIQVFGSVETAGLIHRIAAVMMLVGCVYHLIYLVVRFRRKSLGFGLVAKPKDLKDLLHNLAYFVGLRDEPPRFDKFSYMEKSEYWAVIWGTIIIGGSGMLLWFPEFFTGFLPGWTIPVAHVAHNGEALLAGLAIFTWHFYNVHLRAHVFPMSWVWLTGELTEEQMRSEHPLEYERLMARERPSASAEPASERADESETDAGAEDEESSDG